jgi:hypothetical protein
VEEKDRVTEKAINTAGPSVLRLVDLPKGSQGKAQPKTAQAPLSPLLFWKRDLCQLLRVKVRTLERMISCGEFPAPDRYLRGRPTWLAGTVHGWVEKGCPKTSISA